MQGKVESLTRKDLEVAVKAAMDNALKGIGMQLRADVRQELRNGLQERRASVTMSSDGDRPPKLLLPRLHLPLTSPELEEAAAPEKSLGIVAGQLRQTSPIELQQHSSRELQLALPREAIYLQADSSPQSNGYIGLHCEPPCTPMLGKPSVGVLWQTLEEQQRPGMRSGSSSPEVDPGVLERIVASNQFEFAAGMLVILNALFIGAETNADCIYRGPGAHPPELEKMAYQFGETGFMLLFLLEWILRVCVYGHTWFMDERWYVAWFDTFMVFAQVLDQVCIYTSDHGGQLGGLTMIRCLRLLRILRLLRLLHLFDELGVIVDSVAAAASALFWAVALLMTGLAACSVLFARLSLQAVGQPSDRALYYFGSVPRTFLTLLEAIIGGINWDEPVTILLNEVGLFAGVFFVIYVSLGLFVMLNVATAVFADKAMKAAEKGTADHAINGICAAFELEIKHGHQIDIEAFEDKLAEPSMAIFLEEVGLNAEDAGKLFHIMDSNKTGILSTADLVAGLGKLKNPAKLLDLEDSMNHSRMLHNTLHSNISDRVDKGHETLHLNITDRIDMHIEQVSAKLDAIAKEMGVQLHENALCGTISFSSTRFVGNIEPWPQ